MVFRLCCVAVAWVGVSPAWATDSAPEALTVNPAVSMEELGLLLKPLTRSELVVEADAWRSLLQHKVTEISHGEIARQRTEGGEEAAARLVELTAERTRIVDRLTAVLEALDDKGGDIAEHEMYMNEVSGIVVDYWDMTAIRAYLLGWLKSSEGGLRWGKNIGLFLATLLVFRVLAGLVARAVRRTLAMSKRMSDLLRDFLITAAFRVTWLVGLLIGLTTLEVKLGPVLAVIGAAGFVVGFALQGTLSNFASGLMILAYRPFDIGDAVTVADVTGKVESLNLVSTVIKTFDNQRVVVPNNAVWGNVIINITGLPTRRVDMMFGIGYRDDIDTARAVLERILKDHALVLEDPAPVVQVHELADSSVNFVCRPWTKTADYWAVYWDITRAVKQRFDAEGISIPFPQRDVHLLQQPAPA